MPVQTDETSTETKGIPKDIYIYIYISTGRRKEEVIDENQSFIIIYIYIYIYIAWMKYQEVINLDKNRENKPSRFGTKNWVM